MVIKINCRATFFAEIFFRLIRISIDTSLMEAYARLYGVSKPYRIGQLEAGLWVWSEIRSAEVGDTDYLVT